MNHGNSAKQIGWLLVRLRRQWLPVLLLIVIQVCFALCGIGLAWFSRLVIDSATRSDVQLLQRYVVILLLLLAVQVLLRLTTRLGEVRVQEQITLAIQRQLTERLLRQDYATIRRYHSADLINRLTGDVTVVSEGLTSMIPGTLALLVKLAVAATVLIYLNAWFVLLLIGGSAILMVIGRLVKRRYKLLHQEVQSADVRLRAFWQDLFDQLLVVKTFRVYHWAEARIQVLQNNLISLKIRRATVGLIAATGLSLMFQAGYFGAIVWGAHALLQQTISFGTLAATLQLVHQVQQPLAGLSGLLPKLYAILASTERLLAVAELPVEKGLETDIVSDQVFSFDALIIDQVSFCYLPENTEPVLKDINLEIKRGQLVAIGGKSGIGKSTLIKLLLCIYPVDQGTICFVRHDGSADQIWHIGPDSRHMFAYVPQGTSLFPGTVRDNLTLVRPDATPAELENALCLCCAAEFVQALPLGLDTVIGQAGAGLSEGQAQRLAIVRALLSRAPVLLLDEATSALDRATEYSLLQQLRSIEDLTIIMVSHQQVPFDLCDVRLILDDPAREGAGPV